MLSDEEIYQVVMEALFITKNNLKKFGKRKRFLTDNSIYLKFYFFQLL
jgi:hypothetical protein